MKDRKKLALALCGSFCTFEKLFAELDGLAESYDLIPVMSETAASTDTRFGTAREHIARLERVCGREVIRTVAQAEKLGSIEPADVLAIAPCTGNTLAKLSLGITDSSVTMAAKAHLRNARPLVLALSTNDGLSGSAENIARLMNRKCVHFVPFAPDDPANKPFSLQADFSRLADCIAELM